MRKPVSSVMVLVLLAVPLLGGLVAIAYAADLCLTIGSSPSVGNQQAQIVLQEVGGGKDGKDMNKELGKANKCKVVPAFFSFGGGFLNSGNPIGTATICTSQTATTVRVTTNYFGGSIATDFPLPVPTTSGLTDIVSFNQGIGSAFNIPTTAAVCSPASVPVP